MSLLFDTVLVGVRDYEVGLGIQRKRVILVGRTANVARLAAAVMVCGFRVQLSRIEHMSVRYDQCSTSSSVWTAPWPLSWGFKVPSGPASLI